MCACSWLAAPVSRHTCAHMHRHTYRYMSGHAHRHVHRHVRGQGWLCRRLTSHGATAAVSSRASAALFFFRAEGPRGTCAQHCRDLSPETHRPGGLQHRHPPLFLNNDPRCGHPSSWGSDIYWLSVDDDATYAFFLDIFRRLRVSGVCTVVRSDKVPRHVYGHVYRHVYRHVSRHVYRHVWEHVCEHVCKHVCRHVCRFCTKICKKIHIDMCANLCTDVCIAV